MKWTDYYKIVEFDPSAGQDWMTDVEYHLVVNATDEVVGKYKDHKYAKKQAKYPFEFI